MSTAALCDLIDGKSTMAMVEACLPTLKHFVPPDELTTVLSNCRDCEESDYFIEMLCDLAATIAKMPGTYETRRQSDAMCVLHYFVGGSDWWIIEKDIGDPDDEEPGAQHQAWGLACLNGDWQCAEVGYISLPELFACRAELDLYWKPQPLSKVRK